MEGLCGRIFQKKKKVLSVVAFESIVYGGSLRILFLSNPTLSRPLKFEGSGFRLRGLGFRVSQSTRQLTHENVYPGSFEFLGNPVGLVNNLGTESFLFPSSFFFFPLGLVIKPRHTFEKYSV